MPPSPAPDAWAAAAAEPDEPALHPAQAWGAGRQPAAVQALSWTQRQVLALTARWIGAVIAGPHPGRPGPMCPYVPEALRRGRLHIGVEMRADLPVDALRGRLRRWAQRWLAEPVPGGDAAPLTTLLVAHPFETPDPARSTLHAAVRAERFAFLEAGRMVGVFTMPWQSVPGGGAASWHNPMAVLALRRMVRGDDFFLHTNAAAMALYRRRHPARQSAAPTRGAFT